LRRHHKSRHGAARRPICARRHQGRFIQRLDDTDRARSQPEFEAAIEHDRAWLGLGWDAKERQSERLAHYDRAR